MRVKIKNTKKNKIYLIIGRLTTVILLYVGIIKIGLIILEYIVNNCITTL